MSLATRHEIPDDALLRAYRRGDSAAFDALIRRHYGTAYAIAYARLQDREAAEDLAQEVFLRACLHHQQLRDGSRFAPWICNMARNLATDWQRQGITRSRLLPLVPIEDEAMHQVPDQHRPTAAERAAQEEEQRLADEAIRRLPPEDREVVLLHYSEGLSKSEIARRLGVHPATVGRRLEGAMATLRRSVEESVKAPAPRLRPRPLAPARTMAMVAAVTAMAPEAKAAVAKAAADSVITSAAAQAATKATLLELLKANLALAAGGMTAMSTTKMMIAGGAFCAALAGGGYMVQQSGTSEARAAALAAPSTVHDSMEYQWGMETSDLMEFGKTYEVIFPKDNPLGLASATLTPEATGLLKSTSTLSNGEVRHDMLGMQPGEEMMLPMNTPYMAMVGANWFRMTEDGLHFSYWCDNVETHLQDMKMLVTAYLEGRISASAYRRNYVAILRKYNIGPGSSEFREEWYKALQKDAPIPTMMPVDLQ